MAWPMSSPTLLPVKPYTKAKAELSEVMSEVVRRHHPVVVDRHSGKEQMVLMAVGDLAPMLAAYRFDTRATHEDGEWTLFSPELNLVAGGESFDEALDELVELAEQYATDFFERRAFYEHTDRLHHMPWLLRVAVTRPEDRQALFVEPPAVQA